MSFLENHRNSYRNATSSPREMVGSYNWHEKFPYERYLLNYDGDLRKPMFDNTKDKVAFDFGCGPGRMILRMNELFGRVDGCDLVARLANEAQNLSKSSAIFITEGDNLGGAKSKEYDLIYCTISMQHIGNKDTRESIFNDMNRCLNDNGKISLQMGYRETPLEGVSLWEENSQTSKDVAITKDTLAGVIDNLGLFFSNIRYSLVMVEDKFSGLEGETHGPYWASHWIFLYGDKKVSLKNA